MVNKKKKRERIENMGGSGVNCIPILSDTLSRVTAVPVVHTGTVKGRCSLKSLLYLYSFTRTVERMNDRDVSSLSGFHKLKLRINEKKL